MNVSVFLLDALDDLAHDLGRHIRLPLALLPIDASPAAVREALERAILRTRTGPSGEWSADDLLKGFAEQVPESLQSDLAPLARAVADARRLLDEPTGTAPLDRESARRRLEAVAEAITALRARWNARMLGVP